MDFKELPGQDEQSNAKKNRTTLIALAAVFISPVLLAYLAYFNQWFEGGSRSKGQIIEEPWHIDDIDSTNHSFGAWKNSKYMGKWNWLLVLDSNTCNEQCQINYLMLQQTHLGLSKNTKKNEYLLVLNQSPVQLEGKWADIDYMQAIMNNGQVMLTGDSLKGLNKQPIPSNSIYLVDPLGNIFMRYALVDEKKQAPARSKDLRSDISKVMRVLDVSTKND